MSASTDIQLSFAVAPEVYISESFFFLFSTNRNLLQLRISCEIRRNFF